MFILQIYVIIDFDICQVKKFVLCAKSLKLSKFYCIIITMKGLCLLYAKNMGEFYGRK